MRSTREIREIKSLAKLNPLTVLCKVGDEPSSPRSLTASSSEEKDWEQLLQDPKFLEFVQKSGAATLTQKGKALDSADRQSSSQKATSKSAGQDQLYGELLSLVSDSGREEALKQKRQKKGLSFFEFHLKPEMAFKWKGTNSINHSCYIALLIIRENLFKICNEFLDIDVCPQDLLELWNASMHSLYKEIEYMALAERESWALVHKVEKLRDPAFTLDSDMQKKIQVAQKEMRAEKEVKVKSWPFWTKGAQAPRAKSSGQSRSFPSWPSQPTPVQQPFLFPSTFSLPFGLPALLQQNPQLSQFQQLTQTKFGACYICRQFGHLKKECPNRPVKKE